MLRTKMVCTLGPASSTRETVEALVREGMNLARINMSHGERADHVAVIRLVREVSAEVGRPVAILVDLAGPKIRVGELAEPIDLVDGSEVVLAPAAVARDGEVPTSYDSLADEVEPGQALLLDDGLIELESVAVEPPRVRLRVVKGGSLVSRKGINLPGVEVRSPSLTEKDLADLEFALGVGAEYVGLSFVRRASDVLDLKDRVGRRALVVAKIEKAQALDALEEIMDVSDAVMVARGDLGVELPFEQVPLAQKKIIQLANYRGRPVITATQMLESMIDYPRPTRAEASDVANAILDGTDAVMLSGETAVGEYPVDALRAMVRIAREIEVSGMLERGPRYLYWDDVPRAGASAREHAIASATVDSARQLGSPGIIVITRSGFSARLVSGYRPPVPIFAICTDRRTYTQLAAVWGIWPILADDVEVSYESLTNFGKAAVIATGVGQRDEPVVVTAGTPFHTAGTTNTMRVETL